MVSNEHEYAGITRSGSLSQSGPGGAARSRKLLWTAASCLFSCSCIVFLLLSNESNQALLALAAAGIMLTVYPVYHGLRNGSLDPFEPPVLAAFLSYEQLLRPLYWLSLGGTVLPRYDVSADRVFRACALASLWVDAGFTVYYLCYYCLPPLRGLVAMFPRPKEWSKKRLTAVVLSYFGLGLASYAVFMWQVGGLGYFLQHLAARSSVAEGFQPFLVGSQAMTVGWLMAFLHAAGNQKKLWPYVLMGIPVMVLISSLGGRGYVLFPILFCFGFRHYLVRPINLRALAVIGICFVLFAAAYQDMRNATGIHEDINVKTLEKETKWTPLGLFTQLFQDRNSLDAFAVLIDDMPVHLNFQYGKTWLNLLTLPIPRKIWPQKPILLEGRIFGQTYFDDTAGQPPGYAGALYMNFWYIGIFPGFALLAILHKALYRYLTAARGNVMAVGFYVITVIPLYELSNLLITLWLLWAPFLLLGCAIAKARPVAAPSGKDVERLAGVVIRIYNRRRAKP